MSTLMQDIRYAARQLRKSPGFTLTAVLTLALGIGATTAIFTLVHAVMLRSLPVAKPGELYKVGKEDECCVDGGMQGDWRIFNYDLYKQMRDNTPGFSSVAASQAGTTIYSMRRSGSEGAADATRSRYVSGNYFSTYGVEAYRGRTITPADDTKGAPPVVVISYRLWQRRFALDPSVIGASFLMNGHAVTVVGVTGPEFYGETLQSDPPEVRLPINVQPIFESSALVNDPSANWLQVVGRIKPGVNPKTIEPQLVVELRQFLHSLAGKMRPEELPEIDRQRTELAPGGAGVNYVRDEYDKGLKLLMTVAAFVLLIACANLANLMLVRGMARRQQVSIRMALGAARSRIVRQTLTESVLLAVVGGAAGIAVAFAASRGILALAFRGSTDYVPINATPSWPVLAFAFGTSLVVGVIFGLGPALLTSAANPAEALRGANRSTQDASSLPQKALVVLQAALSLVLLCGAMLLTVSLRNATHQSFGFQTEGRVVAAIDASGAGYKAAQMPEFYRKLDARLSQIPGVQSYSYQMYSPMSHDNWSTLVFIPGQPPPDHKSGSWYNASWVRISTHFMETIGAHITQGRDFTDQDNANTRPVALVNETFARRHYAGRNPIGEHFASDPHSKVLFEIVGVVDNIKFRNPTSTKPVAMYFIPMLQSAVWTEAEDQRVEDESHFPGDIEFLVHGDPASFEPAIRRALAEVDPGLPILNMATFKEQLNTNFNQEELLARLTSLFGFLALVLATVGIYGVTAYSVARRTTEIGVRMALGANRRDVLSMVMRGAFTQIGLGLAIGLPASILAARAASSLLYGVSPYNPICLFGSLSVLIVAAFMASMLPARRAASIEPLLALRAE
jgi:putative ABC transport system permease protein